MLVEMVVMLEEPMEMLEEGGYGGDVGGDAGGRDGKGGGRDYLTNFFVFHSVSEMSARPRPRGSHTAPAEARPHEVCLRGLVSFQHEIDVEVLVQADRPPSPPSGHRAPGRPSAPQAEDVPVHLHFVPRQEPDLRVLWQLLLPTDSPYVHAHAHRDGDHDGDHHEDDQGDGGGGRRGVLRARGH